MFNLIPWRKRNQGGNLKVWHDRDESYPLAQFRDEFDSLWNRFVSDFCLARWDDWGMDFRGGLEDKPNEYVFHAELPGFEPDEIDVKLSGNTLMVRAEHKEEAKEKDSSSYRYGSYQRYFTLPVGVDEEKVDARYHSGILEVHLPKTERAMGKRIPVTAA